MSVIDKVKDALFVFIWHADADGKSLKDLARHLGIEDHVRFVGRVEHDSAALYHRSSEVMISISDRDSGPVALQEAMASGCVPVISDLECVRELISDGHNGLLVDPSCEGSIANALERLLLDDNMRNAMAERNWKTAEKLLDQEKEMEKVEGLYYQAIEESYLSDS